MSGANLRGRLAQIQQQISSLEAQMASLRSEEETVERALAAIVYPVLTLPNDVVSEVFIQYVNGLPKGSPLCLLWVCRSWREVALSTCRLWTRLWRFNSKSNQHLVDALTLWLAQSGSLPFDLGASLPPAPWDSADAFCRLLSQYSCRFRELHLSAWGPKPSQIHLVGSFPRLEKLDMRIRSTHRDLPPILPLYAPNLLEAALDCHSLEPWKAALPWAQLTTLSLESDLYSCWEILLCTSNLEVLTMYAEKRGSEAIPSSSSLTLPRLHTVCLDPMDRGVTSDILPSLTLPALDDLTFWPAGYLLVDAFTELLCRSRCNLRKLELTLYKTDADVLNSVFEETPLESVQNFTLCRPDGSNGALDSLFNLLSDHSVLPALEHFCIEECSAYTELSSLVDFLDARVDCGEGETQLKSFKLSFSEWGAGNAESEIPNPDDIDDAISRLEGLRRRFAGLKVDVRSDISWFTKHIDSHMIQKI
ncbi:hypothetical protein FB45DRAFT_1053279 [Roridomyces roridus]|uniref:F-box domain-containing protein n=1 Tax=Roridomyces roridus TaxID=1738132 RepID=A0AAD7CBQ8_9AGAR|nr:hypothetical protein FB45DRAFT_1053279 [Roridomyces roridus]